MSRKQTQNDARTRTLNPGVGRGAEFTVRSPLPSPSEGTPVGEFGHIGVIGAGFCIDRWGAGPFELEVDGKRHRFEDSDRFGPSRVKANGDICANPLWPERHPFWAAHAAWRKQGRRLSDDGITCVWEPPKPTTYYKVGRKNAVIVEHGDDGGEFIEVETRPAALPSRSGRV